MYFEATSNNVQYKFNVKELKDSWIIDIQKKDEGWRQHIVKKSDYQSFDGAISFIYKNISYLVDCVEEDSKDGDEITIYTRGLFKSFHIYNDQSLLYKSLKSGSNLSVGNSITSGMPGKIVDIIVKVGDTLNMGDPLIIMEAMKMENEIQAQHKLTVTNIFVTKGDNVESGVKLISFEIK